MSRQITIKDLIYKIDLSLNHNRKQTTRAELKQIYMLDSTHPWIQSYNTFNEKIRTLADLGFIHQVNKDVFTIEWDFIDLKLNEWAAVV